MMILVPSICQILAFRQPNRSTLLTGLWVHWTTASFAFRPIGLLRQNKRCRPTRLHNSTPERSRIGYSKRALTGTPNESIVEFLINLRPNHFHMVDYLSPESAGIWNYLLSARMDSNCH